MSAGSLAEHLRLACRYAGVSVRSQLQYRASFVMLALSQFVVTAIEFVGIWALFLRFGSLRGWTLAEVAVLYGMVHVSFALAEAAGRGFDLFPGCVRMGDFDRILLRPRSTVFQIAVQEFQIMRLGRFTQGVAALAWGAAAVHAVWTVVGVLAVAIGVATGAAIFYALFVLQGTLAFWTVETLEIMNTVTYGGTEAAQYPLSIYRGWLRTLFTFVVPLACANYLPAGWVFGRADAPGLPVLIVCPVVGAAFLGVCLWLWRFGEKRYVSTGN